MPSSIVQLHHLLERDLHKNRSKEALISRKGSLTYLQVDLLSSKLGNTLREVGVEKQDRVLIFTGQSLSTVVAIMACSKIGAIFTILDSELPAKNILYAVENCTPVAAVVFEGFKASKEVTNNLHTITLSENNPDLIPCSIELAKRTGRQAQSNSYEGVAALIYTSGSTAKPKAVVCPHSAMLFAISAIQERLNLQETDKIGLFLPFTFDYALYQIFISFNANASLVIGTPADVGPALPAILDAWKITSLPIVPAMGRVLVESIKARYRGTLSHLRMVTNTAEHLHTGLIKDIQNLLPKCKIYPMYGLTECKRVSILDAVDIGRKQNSVGKPLGGTKCVVVDGEGKALPPNIPGELVVFGPHLMSGYWNDEDLTTRKFKIRHDFGRGLFTGDTFRIDEDGYLYFCGRNDDIFKCKGYRLSTLEIEQAALEIKGVEEAVLILSPAQVPILFYRGIVKVPDIKDELRKHLPLYAVPPVAVKRDKFHYLKNGKVAKNSMMDLYLKEQIIHTESPSNS